jgi:hypothetical protein
MDTIITTRNEGEGEGYILYIKKEKKWVSNIMSNLVSISNLSLHISV